MTTPTRTRTGDLVDDEVTGTGDVGWHGAWPVYPDDPLEAEPLQAGGPYGLDTRRGRVLRDLMGYPSGQTAVSVSLAVGDPLGAVGATLLELVEWRLVQESTNVPGRWRITCRGRATIAYADEHPIPAPRRPAARRPPSRPPAKRWRAAA